ncbi:Protein CBG07842 [Caenorhabditis briggsae]|uniref:Protein CBG07842 n=1 Tax=Caenorhabditis briggsae TaxID=6238 RepID=A8X591_CAEBR|nr:Protein CBG07842 [Caenorhabditis briggsae]CAP27790.2 Protein CBG07842 [Caenorhabditis briggsae]
MAGFRNLDYLDLDAPGPQKHVRSEQLEQMEQLRQLNSDPSFDDHQREIGAELVSDTSGSTDSEKASELARILKHLHDDSPLEETIPMLGPEEEMTYGLNNVNAPSTFATTSFSAYNPQMVDPASFYGFSADGSHPSTSATLSMSGMFQPQNEFPSFNISNSPFIDSDFAHPLGNHMDYHHQTASQNPSTSETLYPPGFYGFPAFNIPNPEFTDFGPSYPHGTNMDYTQKLDQATIVEFEKNVVLWSQKYKYNVLNLEDKLVLDEYLFNPNGKVEVPQMVKKPVNSRSLYQNQRSERQGYPPYNSLGEKEKMKWYKLWDRVNQRQRHQFEDGLIRFKTNKNFS